MKRLFCVLLAVGLAFFPAVLVAFAQDNIKLPDVLDSSNGNAILLPNGWRVTPAGHPISLPGDLPLGMVLSPDGKFLLVNTAGSHDHNVDVIDLTTEKIAQSVDVDKDWAGICFNQTGDELYVASGQGYDKSLLNKGAGNGLSPNRLAAMQKSVLCFDWKDDFLMPKPALTVPELEHSECWTAGLTEGLDDSLYVLEMEDNLVFRLSGSPRKTQSTGKVGYRPVAAAISHDGKILGVANWGDASVSLLDAQTLREQARVRVGLHPNALAWGRDGRLFVASAGSNSVSVIQGTSVIETIDVALNPHDLPGCEPDALALTADESRLYVANAGNNAVAVIDTSDTHGSRVLGFIPTGWYPTAVAVSADGKKLCIGVGKGLHSRANVPAIAPDPKTTEDGQRKFDDIGHVMSGVVSVVDVPNPMQLAAYTQQVRENVPTAGDSDPQVLPAGIKHVLYIIREGRSYDQILGDLAQGNGDPSLALFGRYVTPNAHALAQNFVLLDNLYCDGDVSEDGHAWSDAAYATDYIEKVWPSNDSGRDEPDADERLRSSPGGDIWDDCAQHHVTYYNYGEQASFQPGPEGAYLFRGDKALIGHASLDWSLIPLERHDNDRADVFLKDLRSAEKTGVWPQLVVISLAEDKTRGIAPGQYTSLACIAANDQALGRIVQGMTRSRFWPNTAIFVIEADARGGPDHIDAHRTVGLVISPYVKRRTVDSTFYTTTSFLKTIELALGLPPMSQFDAHATPLRNVFTDTPVLSGYKLTPTRIDIDARNP